jgi:hypothetical protein
VGVGSIRNLAAFDSKQFVGRNGHKGVGVKPRLKCDNCDWTQQTESCKEAATWLNKQCPACGKCEIVSMADLMVLAQIQGLEDFGLAGESDSVLDGESVRYEIDTAVLRG